MQTIAAEQQCTGDEGHRTEVEGAEKEVARNQDGGVGSQGPTPDETTSGGLTVPDTDWEGTISLITRSRPLRVARTPQFHDRSASAGNAFIYYPQSRFQYIQYLAYPWSGDPVTFLTARAVPFRPFLTQRHWVRVLQPR